MRSKRSWPALGSLALVAAGAGALLLLGYVSEARKPLPPPKNEATRRAAERERIADDFKRIAHYYKAYCSETKEPTSGGFWAYLTRREDARVITGHIKEQQYAIHVPLRGAGLIAFERDCDLDDTRVVVMADGTVNKAMPDAKFQAICPDRFLERPARR